jgi:hypothetical protein
MQLSNLSSFSTQNSSEMSFPSKPSHYVPLMGQRLQILQPKTLFELLPIDIYHLIHSYLSHFQYRQFLNTSKAVFLSIKYETVTYDLIGLSQFNGFRLQTRINCCSDMLKDNVKDRQKQIKFVDKEIVSQEDLNLLYCVFHGINSIRLFFKTEEKTTFPLHLFSNICHISLHCIDFLIDLSSLNGNIITLELDEVHHLVDINHIQYLSTLEKVVFRNCERLSDISCLKNISHVEVMNCKLINDISVICNKQKCLIFKMFEEQLYTSFNKHCVSFYQIERLEIIANLTKYSFSFLQETKENQNQWNLKYLKLINDGININKSLPFQSRLLDLVLNNFDISNWKAETLSSSGSKNLPRVRVNLFSCRLPDNCDVNELFPGGIIKWSSSFIYNVSFLDFSSCNYTVSSVSINHIDDLTSISLKNCKIINLTINSCVNLVHIEGINSTKVSISFCENFQKFTEIENLQKISIQYCHAFADLTQLSTSSVSQITEVVLDNCSLITSLKGILSKGNIRKLYLTSCNGITSIDDLLSDVQEMEQITKAQEDCYTKMEIHITSTSLSLYENVASSKEHLSKLHEYVVLTLNGSLFKDSSSVDW